MRNIRIFSPSTWVQKRGYVAETLDETGKVIIGDYGIAFTTLSANDLLRSAIEGPRSGLWMKHMINM
ncbi:MAG: hypothetical protein NT033_07625, partial [Candidatus Omnitrophica bacterium]|nr:hypothetical protein [Candidatus Omnitrophota bacterium]